jgi:hypothetical protein
VSERITEEGRLSPDSLKDEVAIIWTEDVSGQRYVREMLTYAYTRRRPMAYHGNGRAVGYAALKKDARTRTPRVFLRRVFWLAPWDPYEGGGAPCEGVDPSTVEPRKPGVQTARALGREP